MCKKTLIKLDVYAILMSFKIIYIFIHLIYEIFINGVKIYTKINRIIQY